MTSGSSAEDLAAMTQSRQDLAAVTKEAARDYVEVLTTRPKDKAACEEARARYKAAQAAEIQAVCHKAESISKPGLGE